LAIDPIALVACGHEAGPPARSAMQTMLMPGMASSKT
jgi:hypothetical protein